MPDRYAIYFAPDRSSQLWHLAAQWLGRDAATGHSVPQTVPEGIAPQTLRALTESARTYGFHATLKPPMRVPMGQGFSGLQAGAISFSQTFAPAPLGEMEVRLFSGFLALMPKEQAGEVSRLAAECVTLFDHLRQPLTAAERDRWQDWPLDERQTELLEDYGYPFVMEEYRFHMTLSDPIPEDMQPAFLEAARAHFAPALADPIELDRIAIYHEMEEGAPFMRIADFELRGQA